MKKQKTYDHNGDRTDSNITPETIKSKKTFSNAIQFCSNYIKNPDIPCDQYITDFSMPSPQTPRNIRRLQLGIDTPTDQILTTPKQSSCLTSSKSQDLQPQMPTSIPLSFEQRKRNNKCNVHARDVGSEQLSTTSKQQDPSIQKKRNENSFRKFSDKRQRKRISDVLKDITNIDLSLGTENQESPTSTIFPDTEFGVNINDACELEFDCSSLDTTDSENETDVDLPSFEYYLINTEKSTAAKKDKTKM
ncbi:hypothetical protein IGI04_014727, partial [Brassica rapa subsp. trilocularis]